MHYWEKVNSDKKNRLYMRYIEDGVDYLEMLKNKRKERISSITPTESGRTREPARRFLSMKTRRWQAAKKGKSEG